MCYLLSHILIPYIQKKRGEIKMKKLSCPAKKLRQYIFAVFVYLAILGTLIFTLFKIRFVK